jgi:hypothetical protein
MKEGRQAVVAERARWREGSLRAEMLVPFNCDVGSADLKGKISVSLVVDPQDRSGEEQDEHSTSYSHPLDRSSASKRR